MFIVLRQENSLFGVLNLLLFYACNLAGRANVNMQANDRRSCGCEIAVYLSARCFNVYLFANSGYFENDHVYV